MTYQNPQPKIICAIDPGLSGAIVFTDGKTLFRSFTMPIQIHGKEKEIDFFLLKDLLASSWNVTPFVHVYLERAIPFAMGSKAAFNYGKGAMATELAIRTHSYPMTLVEPARWTKIMHEGISADMKPKAKSALAVQRLFPHFLHSIPKSKKGKPHEGIVDALLIAGYALRPIGD